MAKKEQKKPKYCADCGGQMLYAEAFGRVFSCCSCCSPVIDMNRVAKAARIGVFQRGEFEGE